MANNSGDQMSSVRSFCAVLLLIVLLPSPSIGQTPSTADPCAMPVFSQIVNEKNIFSEEQEEWLGEIIDQSFKKEFHTVDDREGRLQKLGERLLAQLPPTRIHYRFVIVDSPELNSFGLVGGR